MATLSKKQERSAKVLKPTLNHKENIHDLSCRQLKSLDITLVLAAYGSLSTVNLSNNLLVTLPDSFCRVMGHIQYLDLSNNRLQKLPENFGLLQKLHTLILYQNKLQTLPVSFGTLEKLRWLDIAANPWRVCMRKIFGEDVTQCAVVAKNVREFFFLVQNAAENCTEPGIDPAAEWEDSDTYSRRSSVRIGDADQVQTQDQLNDMTLDLLRETEESSTKYDSNAGDTNQTIHERLSFYRHQDMDMGKRLQRSPAPVSKTLAVACFMLILLAVSITTAFIRGPPKSLLKNGSMQSYEWIPSIVVDSLAWIFWCTFHPLQRIFPNSHIDSLSELLVTPRNPSVLNLMFGL
ncbi:unnamed protein product [Allacma fusca]|uniref:Leucine-rich repeat-containing protein n=1 Tax=Allacma fusca TaxID=39272 RepID=A0A8J2L545_9HEXA|nr:unnamed protein product [Allacma fusca]